MVTSGQADMAKVERLPTIGVMGSGKVSHESQASLLGEWLAKQDVHLLTGGGCGVMESVSRAFAAVSNRKGKVIGIIPGTVHESAGVQCVPSGYPNRWVEIAIFTHLPYSGNRGHTSESRNHINILSSDAIVVLPGSDGTASEAALAARYRKPAIAWLQYRSQMTGLPDSVPVVTRFDDVKLFVKQNIG